MSDVFDLASFDWQPVRPDVAHGVWGKTLLEDSVKIVLTRVAPGGKFAMHRDTYSHLFYFLSGVGVLWINGQQSNITPGLVVRVTAGDSHAYENTGDQDLLLISLNLPAH